MMRQSMTKRLSAVLIPLLLLLFAQQALATTTVALGTDPTKYVIKGKMVTPDQVINGEMVIEGDTITCVATSCSKPSGATVMTVTNAYIYPGFIDAHNHVAYNFLPKWTPPKLYQNRGQWQRSTQYKEFKKPYAELKDKKGLFCEMVKYGEIKALISGVTTIQGTAPKQKCFSVLIRNAENYNNLGLPTAHIRTFILDISGFDQAVDWSKTKSFVVHLSEGIDEKSRAEFDTLKSKGLLKEQTVIIHGTALGEPEFQDIALAGSKLVWSPKSNLVLYGKTTNVKLALSKGIPVSLGVDWNPTGSDNMFDELRIAEQVNHDEFDDAIQSLDWIKMITSIPARALALQEKIGMLSQGHKADITVVKSKDSDPNKSLLNNHLQDVEMVWVGGELLYSDETIMKKVKPDLCEALVVNGARKSICVRDTKHSSVPKAGQTLQEIQDALYGAYPNLAPLVP